MENHKGPVELKGFQQNSERLTDTTNNDCKNSVKEESGENVDNLMENNPNSTTNGYIISDTSRQVIHNILEQVNSLSPLERFLVFIKLNEQISNAGDPLKQPLNPLGSRSEVCRTISWIKTHLEEDPEISLPKQQVYDEYTIYCTKIRMKPLSQADFGKVMKQVYPKVKARRLGTRGNSRYCYSGLRNCTKLRIPTLPSLEEDSSLGPQMMYFQDEKKPLTQISIATAAWLIVKQWSEIQLKSSFSSLQALAFFLVVNCSVAIGTEAANHITAMSSSEITEETEVLKTDQSHRDVQIQLQKKILQKEEAVRDRKRKLQASKLKTCSKKKNRASSTNELVSESSPSESSASSNTSPVEGKTICDKNQDYNNKTALPEFNCFQKSILTDETNREEDPLVKVSALQADLARQTEISSLKSVGTKYKTIQPKPLYQLCDNMYNPLITADNRSQNSEAISDKKKEIDEFQTELPLSRERLNSISNVEKDAMDDYLGKNNSQHEEELSKYFSRGNNEIRDTENTSKISQLRQLLQENGLSKTKMLEIDTNSSTEHASNHNSPIVSYPTMIPAEVEMMHNMSVISSSARRRVSFDVVLQDETVPPSPNTRCKNFSFTPISPGPNSPPGNGIQSKCSSTNVSPFVSPRNTPIPRGRNYQNLGLTLQILPSRKSSIISSKVKKEIDLSPELLQEKEVGPQAQQNKKTLFAMSAPPSPMLPNKPMLLQTLLNTSGKVSYTPDYVHQPVMLRNNKSSEISQLISNDPVLNLSENNTFRSQSVPLHQMDHEKDSFLLSSGEFLPPFPQEDFDELETIEEDEKLGVTNIINSLNDQVYNNNNIDMLSITDKCSLIEGNLTKDSLLLSNTNFQKSMPSRNLGRSLSIDVLNFDQKSILSRSVPSTPLPYIQLTPQSTDVVIQNSHSYPSTPLISDDSFNYNIRDCLINGQPIKNDELSQVYNEAYVTFESLDGDSSIVLEDNDNIHFLDKTSVTSSDQNYDICIN